MSKKSSRRLPKKPMITQTVIHPDAAGIDLASEVHYVAVPADRDPQPVRNFLLPQTAVGLLIINKLRSCRFHI